MSKRGNGEGTISKRKDGRWMGRVTVPGQDGRSARKTVYGRTRKDVAVEISKLLGDVRQGLPIGEKTMMGEFLIRWLEDSAKPSVRQRTFIGYEQIVRTHLIPSIRTHLIPSIGSIALHKLQPADLQRAYAAKLAGGLSPRTISHIHAVIHRALAQAARWGLVSRNVAALVDLPKQVKHEIRPLTPDQVRAFLEEAKGTRFEALFVLAISTGMRQGELLGLRWQDVDLDTARLYVRQTVTRAGGGFTFAAPKTHRSERGITLSNAAVVALRAHKVRQSEERLRASAHWQDYGLVFSTSIGTPMAENNLVRREFKPLLQEAGLPAIRFHDLRHTAATLLLTQNIHPKKVQELLGHSQIGMTMDRYSHLLPTTHDEAANKMDLLLGTG